MNNRLPAIVGLFSRQPLVTLDAGELRQSYIETEQGSTDLRIADLENQIAADKDEMARIRDRCRQRMFILAGERAKAKVLARFTDEAEQGALSNGIGN